MTVEEDLIVKNAAAWYDSANNEQRRLAYLALVQMNHKTLTGKTDGQELINANMKIAALTEIVAYYRDTLDFQQSEAQLGAMLHKIDLQKLVQPKQPAG